MIIFDNDYKRIFRHLLDDNEKVTYYLDKCQNGIVRKHRKERMFPVWHYETITIPRSKNTYLIYYYAKNADERDYAFNHFYGALLMLNDSEGRRMVITYRGMIKREQVGDKMKDEPIDTLQVYSGHFFSRYRERMGFPSTMTVNDLITTFFGRNGQYFTQLNYEDIVLEKNRHKGNCAFAVEDGVLLSEEIDCGEFFVYKHNTFLSLSDLKSNQRDATPSAEWMREQVLTKCK